MKTFKRTSLLATAVFLFSATVAFPQGVFIDPPTQSALPADIGPGLTPISLDLVVGDAPGPDPVFPIGLSLSDPAQLQFNGVDSLFNPNSTLPMGVTVVPEPGTVALLALGLLGAGIHRHRRNKHD